MYILGISAFYHDSAAALLCDGEIAAAAQEERFTRIKHDFAFPKHSVDYCLREVGIAPEELNAVVFYDKPLLKFERILETYLAFAPWGLRSFMMALPLWVKEKLFLPREIDEGLNGRYEGPIYFAQHHESHAASAFFPSPFEEAAIITLDGVGEWNTTSWGVGEYFEMDINSPYMLLVAPVREERRKPMTDKQRKLFGVEKLNIARSDIPAITHIDYSARIQTVNQNQAPGYYRLIKRFEERTGWGVIVNTSFNIRGEPIVCSPEDAYRCFMYTDMDALAIENCLCLKAQQPPMQGVEEYKKQFKLD